jgi:hypothetical protein
MLTYKSGGAHYNVGETLIIRPYTDHPLVQLPGRKRAPGQWTSYR